MTDHTWAQMLGETLAAQRRTVALGLGHFRAGLEVNELRTAALGCAAAALRRRMYLEEEALFPPRSVDALTPAVHVMLREHAVLWVALERIERATAHGDAPAARAALATLLPLLDDHHFKEERIVYRAADHAMSAEAEARLHAVLRHPMPAGWTCRALGRERGDTPG